jgi:hypothetical protein
MWLQGLGIALTGSTAPDNGNGPLGIYTEWGMRVPFALLSILAVSMITLAIGRSSAAAPGSSPASPPPPARSSSCSRARR